MRDQDLRVYTIWRAEISHFKTQRKFFEVRRRAKLRREERGAEADLVFRFVLGSADMSYRKTGTEVRPFHSFASLLVSSLRSSKLTRL